MISALLAAAAARAGLTQAPVPEQAGVWLYSEALPQGWLDEAQAALIMRGLSLVQAPVVPDALLTSLLDDSRVFILAAV